MSQKLHTTAVAAIGELQLLTQVQELQDISLEKLEQAQWTISGLLITCYLYLAQLCFESLELERLEIRHKANNRNNFFGGAA
jgi:hypothetical protein